MISIIDLATLQGQGLVGISCPLKVCWVVDRAWWELAVLLMYLWLVDVSRPLKVYRVVDRVW